MCDTDFFVGNYVFFLALLPGLFHLCLMPVLFCSTSPELQHWWRPFAKLVLDASYEVGYAP